MPNYKTLLKDLRFYMKQDHVKNGLRWKPDGITNNLHLEKYQNLLDKRRKENNK